MKRYRFSYQTIVRYGTLIVNHHFLLRCTPRVCSGQRVMEQNLELLGSSRYFSSVDIFGNTIHYGYMPSRHNIFVVASNGVVECDRYEIKEPAPMPMFLASTRLTELSREMIEFGRGVDVSPSATPLEQALQLCDLLQSHMRYVSGVTTAESRAMDSFALGEGVCQDFAHILIAMCRERSIMARYVAGLVVGTGETHAWVEIYCDGAWRGVDPTHNLLIEYGYIKLSHGRDAADCSVARGVHQGVASQSTEVNVVVEELL